jgi:alkylhydroperoxidase/carboxymuconolactone decarboxylase family protein YurZ
MLQRTQKLERKIHLAAKVGVHHDSLTAEHVIKAKDEGKITEDECAELLGALAAGDGDEDDDNDID